MLPVSLSSVFLLLVTFAPISWQDAENPPAAKDEKKAPVQQAKTLQGPAARTIKSIKDYRGGVDRVPYIRRLEESPNLDLSGVDYNASVLARVNGQDITQNEYMLWYALNAGQNGVRRAQLDILTRDGVESLLAEGGAADRLDVSDEDVAAKLKEEEDAARAQGEDALAKYRTQIENSLGWDKYRTFVKSHLRSERYLLPPIEPLAEGDEPQGLPLQSAELLEGQPELRDYLNNAYLSGQDIPQMFRGQFLRMLQQGMIDKADIRYALEEDLPEGVYMVVNETPVTVGEVLEMAVDKEVVREGALSTCMLYTAMDDALQDGEALIGPEEFKVRFDAHRSEYEGTLFPLPNLITLRGFLNMSEYREYYRRRCGFQKMHKGLITDDDLKKHQEQTGRLFYESGKVNCEIFWVSIPDTEEKFEVEGDAAWEKARERADQVKAALLAGDSAAEVREKYCSPDAGFPAGVTTHRMRNELRQVFSENDYNIFTSGYSLCDDVFYNRVEGEIVGPYKMDKAPSVSLKDLEGYMLVRVIDFQKTQKIKPFDIQRPLIESDYYDLNFANFAQECMKNARIELGPFDG